MDRLTKEQNTEKQPELKPIEKVGEIQIAKEKIETEKQQIDAEKRKTKEIDSKTQKTKKKKSTIGQPGIDTSNTPLHQNIESILEEDLEEVYFSMNEKQQEEFRETGEETTQEIIGLIQNAKATFKKIFKFFLLLLRGPNPTIYGKL